MLLATAAADLGHGHAGRVSGLPPNVLLATGRTEPAIALGPGDGRHIAVAANPAYFASPATRVLNGTFASSDGGATWTQGTAPTYGTFNDVADPSLATDAAGRVYYLYMGENPSYCGESGNVALLLARSDDGGRTFGAPTVVDVNPADDKPFVAVRTSGGHTSVFAVFTRWTTPNPQIMFARSDDGGQTFAPPATLYTSSGMDMGALPVVGPGSRLYVLWAHYDSTSLDAPVSTQIMLRGSNDDGHLFGPPVVVAAFTGLPRLLQPGALRLFTFPTAAVDRRNGALYVAWMQARALSHPAYAGQSDADVMLSRSRNGGRTWTRPVALNDTPTGDRFMPALAVGADGTIRVAFYDRRVDGLRFGLYGVAARDRGTRLQVWPNRQISAVLSSPLVLHYIAPGSTCTAPGRFMGDYIDAATAPDGTFDTVWTDTARGVAGESDLQFVAVPRAYLLAGVPRSTPW